MAQPGTTNVMVNTLVNWDDTDSASDAEEYLNGHHYTLSPTDPGYQLQRDQRLRARLYVEVINILQDRETVSQALQRLRAATAEAESAHNSKKDKNSDLTRAQDKSKSKKEFLTLRRLEDLIRRLQQIQGNEDLLICNFPMLAKKISAPKCT